MFFAVYILNTIRIHLGFKNVKRIRIAPMIVSCDRKTGSISEYDFQCSFPHRQKILVRQGVKIGAFHPASAFASTVSLKA